MIYVLLVDSSNFKYSYEGLTNNKKVIQFSSVDDALKTENFDILPYVGPS